MSEVQNVEIETVNGGELVFRATEPAAMRFRDEGEGARVVEGRMMPYGEWTEVRSAIEGHFLESFAVASLAKTILEQAQKLRALFEHGLDRAFGRQTIAEIDELRDEPDGAYYRMSLLDGLPPLLVSGLKRGLYGSSVRFRPEKMDRARFPKRSEYNPDGIEERTVREASIRELSITAFPVYAGATAHVRSLTDEFAAKQLLGDPTLLLEMLRSTTKESEPPHSEEETPPEPDPAPEDEAEESRSTQPVRDYLSPQEGAPSWRLK